MRADIKLYSHASIAPPIKPSTNAQKKPMILPAGDMVKPRYTRPIKVGSPVAPSKRIIHQVNKKRPKPQIIPQVSANALTFSFNLTPPLFLWLTSGVSSGPIECQFCWPFTKTRYLYAVCSTHWVRRIRFNFHASQLS